MASAIDEKGARFDEQPLRILHVFRAPLGGLFRHVIDLARGQVERGHHVGIFCDERPGNAFSEGLLKDVQPDLKLGLTRLPMHRNPHVSDFRVLAGLRTLAHAQSPDVMHGHGSKGGLYARLPGFLTGGEQPIRAYTPHGGSLNYKPGSALHRLYMKVERVLEMRTDVFCFESEYIRQRYASFVGEPKKALVNVVCNGIHPHEFEPVTHDSDARDFVYVGEFREAKGLDILIQAMAAVRDRLGRAPTLVMVGSGPDLDKIKADIARLGLTDSVEILTARAIRQALARGRCIVVPSRAESLPYVVLEAAGAAQPMISTNVGGIPEVFGPMGGRLIAAGNTAALADAMAAMMTCPEPERRAGAIALADYVRAHFSVAGMVDGIIGGYRKAIARRTP